MLSLIMSHRMVRCHAAVGRTGCRLSLPKHGAAAGALLCPVRVECLREQPCEHPEPRRASGPGAGSTDAGDGVRDQTDRRFHRWSRILWI